MNWKRCSDEMPKRHETVLVVYGHNVRVAKYNGDHWDMGGGNYGCTLDMVSHWMPFPELPGSIKSEIEELELQRAKLRAAEKQAELERMKRDLVKEQALIEEYETRLRDENDWTRE